MPFRHILSYFLLPLTQYSRLQRSELIHQRNFLSGLGVLQIVRVPLALLLRKTSLSAGCVFKFVIGVHIDDTRMLEKIQEKLGLGTVRRYKNMSYFIVSKLSEVKVLIDIFSLTPLNTSKRLNFLALSAQLTC